jgi:hypothetical protein
VIEPTTQVFGTLGCEIIVSFKWRDSYLLQFDVHPLYKVSYLGKQNYWF